jgi:peptidoglycan/LPS O-acetylase OafA/YrhL
MPLCGWRSVLTVTLALAIACGVMRAIAVPSQPFILTHLRIDSLAFGVLLAYVYHFHRTVFDALGRHRVTLPAFGLALVAAATVPNAFLAAISPRIASALVPAMLAVGYGACLVWIISRPSDRGWFGTRAGAVTLRVLATIGLYSYPIYLFHVDVGYRLARCAMATGCLDSLGPGGRWTMGMALYIALAIATGVLLARCIETPMLALRERLFPRSASPVSVDSAVALVPRG